MNMLGCYSHFDDQELTSRSGWKTKGYGDDKERKRIQEVIHKYYVYGCVASYFQSCYICKGCNNLVVFFL